MSIWNRFRAAPAVAVTRVEPRLSADASPVQSESQWRGLAMAGGYSSKAGVQVNERSALSVPATLQALRILTGVFAMTPLHYFRRDDTGRQRADSDPLWTLLHDQPNSHQSAFAFKELLLGDLLLTGDFYAYISRDARGVPVALTRLKKTDVTIWEHFDRRDGITLFYDATLPDGSRERFAARDIWHVAGFTRNGLSGLNPIDYARDALGGAIATANHASQFWGNGGKPSTILRGKQKISPEDKLRMRADYKALYGGPAGDDVAVFDQDLDVKFLTETHENSQFVETRGFQVVDQARLWGVPPHLLFDLSKASFANIEQQSLEFVIYHLGPIYERVSSAATRQFAPDGYYFEFITDALVKGDLKSRMEAYWLQRQMGTKNGNELRRMDNDSDIPGDAGTEYWRPANMALAGTPFAAPAAVQVSTTPGQT